MFRCVLVKVNFAIVMVTKGSGQKNNTYQRSNNYHIFDRCCLHELNLAQFVLQIYDQVGSTIPSAIRFNAVILGKNR